MEYVTLIAPFFKNLTILYLVVFILFLASAINKSGGMTAFSMVFWLEENKGRFQAGAVFIACLSILMALTDVSPLFKVLGFDINASPVGLGLAIAGVLGLAKTKTARTSNKGTKAKAIQKKAGEIVKESAAIVQEEKDKKGANKS